MTDLVGKSRLKTPKQPALFTSLNNLIVAKADSGIVMVDGTFFGDSFEQDQSWDDSGTTISGI